MSRTTTQGSPRTGREPLDSGSASTTSEANRLRTEIEQATSLLKQGKVTLAADSARRALQLQKDNTEALYLAAVCERYMKRPAEALELLKRLVTVKPGHARAYQEAGHNYLLLDKLTDAGRSFQQAVRLNPGLVASWKNLREAYIRLGETEAAQRTKEQLGRLQKLPRELVSVTSMLHEGRLFKAEQLCRSYLRKNPKNVEGMRLLAELGVRLLVLDDAEFLLESCVEFEPDHLMARYDYARVLHKRQKYEKALEEATYVRSREPGNPAFELLFANENVALGEYDKALQVYDEIITANPALPATYLARGHALKTIGRIEDAVKSYRQSIEVRPDFGDAYWSLANLKTYEFSNREIKRMQAVEKDKKTGLADRYHVCFALGKAFEDRTRFRESFAYYERGNALKKEESRYQPERIEKEFLAQKEVCTAELLNRDDAHGCPDLAPIFIVGLPRAGSTLLEQILASHSLVEGTMELPNILALAHRLNGRRMVDDDPRYPGVLPELTPEQLQKFGEKYIEDTSIYRNGAPYFIDKMPNNFRHIGLIHLILPNAKIIDARRHPMACCFSGFKQLFAEGQEFTYGLEEIGRYYRAYVDLMGHWDQVLPGKVLRIQYEDVVDDLETQVMKILEFCELLFERQCIRFHETTRPIHTPSSEQVRQPIYTSGKEQWRNYEVFFDGLRKSLGSALQGND